jgi:hypothetical protein
MKPYSRKPNKSGGGANPNINGLSFEGRTSLIESLKSNPEIHITNGNIINYRNKKIGYYTEKHHFYNSFLSENKINWQKINSKKYLPDSVIVNEIKKIVYIIEKKYQAGSGSVDEKLQTCDFKKQIYKKLIDKTGYKTEYYYLLNDWYHKNKYDDVKKYIISVGCKYFINKIELEELGIK